MKKSLSVVLFMLVSLSVVFTKDISINVFDRDIDIPLEGVKLIEPKSGSIAYTNQNGDAILQIDSNEQIMVIADYVGYQSRKIIVAHDVKTLKIGLSMEFVLEGKDLIIEGKAPGKTDEKVGVSKVVEKNEMKSTAMSGPMQDVMSTVKTLPGVVYAGKFSPNFSVRGGEPSDLTTVLDGFVVRYPWHWGGGFSIFNPNIVDSLKFSAGIFSAKYGPAMSGLMEVNTITPNDGVKLQVVLSIMTAEVLLQTPIVNEKSGLYIGGRLTSQDLPLMMVKPLVDQQGVSFTRSPYIYDGYFKWFIKPVDRFEWYINGFVGADGVSMIASPPEQTETTHIVTKSNFSWLNFSGFVNTGFKVILPGDKVFMHFLGGYEYHKSDVNGKFTMKGTRNYSDKFKKMFSITVDSFQMDNSSQSEESDVDHSAQGRFDTDVTITDRIMFSIGLGGLYQWVSYSGGGEMYRIGFKNELPVYEPFTYSISKEDKSILTSFAYMNFDFKVIPEIFDIEIGMRTDHMALFGKALNGEEYDLQFYPVPEPRLNFFLTPFKPNNIFQSMTFSLGVGLFSKGAAEIVAYEKSFGLKNFTMPIGKTLTVVTGIETLFPFNIKVKAEGYFKYQFDRFYMNTPPNNNGKIVSHSDGYGYSTGFDLSIERKMSPYLDGSLSYSFCDIRMFNPTTDGMSFNLRNDPVGIWYYPRYHRFHSMNLILNARPTDFFTITSKLSIASGKPQREASDTQMFMAFDQKGNILELYAKNYTYSDTLRTEISIPFDLKVTFNFYIPNSKVYVEIYAGVEDLFAPAYSPMAAMQTDMFSGEDTRGTEAKFDIGAPLPSIGFTVNF